MTMDSGGERPNEADDQPSEDSENWYFNLPGGAWERQEEKNRELRERVHRNLETPSPRTDPFSAPKKDEKRGFFGRGKNQDEPEEHTTAGGTFRLAKGGLNAAEQPAQADDHDDSDWSSEPMIPLRRRAVDEAPLPLPSTEWDANDDAPGEDILGSMRKWSSSSPGDGEPIGDREFPLTPAPRSASSWPAEEDPATGAASEPAPLAPTAPPAPSLPLTFKLNRPERETETKDDTPSRWKDVFSGGAEESGGLASMREWAESGPVLPPRHEPRDEPNEIPAEFLKPFDWETENAVTTTPAEFLKPFEWETTTETAADGPVVPAAVEPAKPQMPSSLFDEKPWESVSAAEPTDGALADEEFSFRAEPETSIPSMETSAEKPAGLFGRLFGRKTRHESLGRASEPAAADPAQRTAARLSDAATTDKGDWLPAAEPEAEPVADENLWNWPAEPTALVVEDAAPAFDAAPPAEVEAEVEPVADENLWNWPAEPTAMTPEDAAPAFDAAPPAEVEAEAEPPAEETGWDPEPFDAAVPVRPGFAVAAALGEPSLEEPVEEFSFLFEPESAEEERFAAPAVWLAPVSFVASEPADEERPWWEPADEEEPPQVVAGLPKALEVPPLTIELPPTPTPAVDLDAWDEVPSIDSGVAAASVADSPPQPAQPVDDRWTVFVPEPNAADPVTSLTSVAEERTFTFDRRSATSERVNTDESPERAWASFGDEGHAGSLSAPLETALPESDVDDLATSLESQMAVADDERQARSRWDEDDGSRRAVSARYQEDDDVVLRAFNAHAATPDPEPAPIDRNLQRAEDEAFDELLGAGAADIVAEAADEEEPARSFLNPRPSMALRRDMPENPFDAPWEQDEGEPRSYRSPVTDLRPASGTGSGADLPWGREFSFDDDSAAPAVSSHARHDRTKSVVREVVETVMLALLVFLCVRASFQNFKVDGSSMYPTLENGQFLIVNKLVYSEVDMEKLSNFIPLIDAASGEKRNVFHGPERGDIIVLQDPRKPEVDLIKRVIGLPGETLEVIDGKVYINDFLLEEPYIKTVWHGTNAKQLVPPGQYFVMGDNRDNSLDSRSQQVGFVPKDLIIGKTLVSYWPKSKFGLAPNEAGNISTQDGVPKLTAQTVDEARLGR